MSTALPITFHELFQLPSLGIDPRNIGFSKVTLNSDKYICIREETTSGNQVVVIDVSNPHSPTRFPAGADSAVMNPSEPILALKAGTTLQIFNISAKNKVNDFTMPEEVTFWRWINSGTIGIVTKTSVWHWGCTSPGSKPQKIFSLDSSLAGCDIINYKVDASGQWCVLVGLTQDASGQIVGRMQLYSVEKKGSQAIEGNAAAFGTFTNPGASKPSTFLVFAAKSASQSKLYIFEVAKGDPSAPAFGTGGRLAVDVPYPAEAGADFPVSMEISEKFNMIYMITKFGYLRMFYLGTGETIYMNRISADTIFATTSHKSVGGILGINGKGQVLSISVNEANVIPYIVNTLHNVPLAIRISSTTGLKGAEGLFSKQFDQFFAAGRYDEAARIAAESPGGILRNSDIIAKFKSVPGVAGQPSPLFRYLSILLETTKLNKEETLELVKPVLQAGKAAMVTDWLTNEKITPSEDLGDIVKSYDPRLALQIYYLAEAKSKVVTSFAELGQFDRIVTYCQKVDYKPDWNFLLQSMLVTNPAGAVEFAKMLTSREGDKKPMCDINVVVDTFMTRNMIPETTKILLDYLEGDRPEDAALQTRVLEINLRAGAPQIADAILGGKMFSHYDKPRIAQLCEGAGLYQRALEHYTDFTHRKRVMVTGAATMNTGFLIEYFKNLDDDQALEVLDEMLSTNLATLPVALEIAVKYADLLDTERLINMFEKFGMEALFSFLGRLVNTSKDSNVHFKYIEAAAKLGRIEEVTRMCRDSKFYNPERTRDFLMEAKLPDQLPLIIVCDRWEFVPELTRYLYKNGMQKHIEVYVQQINSENTPLVVGALLEVDASDEFIQNLLSSVGPRCPIAELVAQVEKRNKLKMIRPWLEERAKEGNTEPALHNALAKVYISLSMGAEEFLKKNEHYDPKVVGKFCEKIDPYLAFVAYRKGGAECEDDLIEVTNKSSLFKNQARYLVERQDPALWEKVLTPDNPHRRALIDQVVQSALPESKNTEEVSATVRAFMQADLPSELIELLEKIVLESSDFSDNKHLQNLLILTAIKADKTRVMGYVKRLNKYNATDIADVAIDGELYEEAFTMYEKFNFSEQAMKVLVTYIKDLDRASKYAARIDQPKVYSLLGHAQLQGGKVKEGIQSFIKAQDAVPYMAVITAAENANLFDDLVEYLQMCRANKVKNATIHSELCYAFAKTDKLAELSEFISGTNNASILDVGDKCFRQGLYEAAKILYMNVSNYQRLATTFLKLGDFAGAVDAARKAGSTRTWKEVCFACVQEGEFKMAQTAGLQIIVHGDELEELCRFYEVRGHWEELMKLIEQGFASERAHVGMFTQLAILFSKYKPERLMDHIKMNHSRINIGQLLRVCDQNQQWKELVFLHNCYKEPENAINVMIRHSTSCWDHSLFKDTMSKINNPEVVYRAVDFYLKMHPLQLVDLLQQQVAKPEAKPDPSRIVSIVRSAGHLPLIKPYLVAIQEENIADVNDALNELYIEEEDFKSLRHSINTYDDFDQLKLANQLKGHELVEFRRVAAELFKKNKQFSESVALSKEDDLYSDAMKTAADSGKPEVVEQLLRFFIEKGNKECFAACLYTCYDLVQPDVALELAWSAKMIDFVMPYMIQFVKEYTTKVDRLVEAEQVAKEAAAAPPTAIPTVVPGSMMVPPPGSVMVGPPVMMHPGIPPMPGSAPGQMAHPGAAGSWHRTG